MYKRINERNSAITFWCRYKEECLQIRSIKEVYQKYKQFATENNLLVLNEYIFRTYIRKHGYCNTIAEKDLEKVDKKKKIKKLLRIEKKIS